MKAKRKEARTINSAEEQRKAALELIEKSHSMLVVAIYETEKGKPGGAATFGVETEEQYQAIAACLEELATQNPSVLNLLKSVVKYARENRREIN